MKKVKNIIKKIAIFSVSVIVLIAIALSLSLLFISDVTTLPELHEKIVNPYGIWHDISEVVYIDSSRNDIRLPLKHEKPTIIINACHYCGPFWIKTINYINGLVGENPEIFDVYVKFDDRMFNGKPSWFTDDFTESLKEFHEVLPNEDAMIFLYDPEAFSHRVLASSGIPYTWIIMPNGETGGVSGYNQERIFDKIVEVSNLESINDIEGEIQSKPCSRVEDEKTFEGRVRALQCINQK
jgi:hypothetical protein